MAKTVKYGLYHNFCFTPSLVVPLSKKEFDRQLKFYKKEVDKNHKCLEKAISECKARGGDLRNIENYMDMTTTVEETEKIITTDYAIVTYEACIHLCKRECKPGYHWE